MHIRLKTCYLSTHELIKALKEMEEHHHVVDSAFDLLAWRIEDTVKCGQSAAVCAMLQTAFRSAG